MPSLTTTTPICGRHVVDTSGICMVIKYIIQTDKNYKTYKKIPQIYPFLSLSIKTLQKLIIDTYTAAGIWLYANCEIVNFETSCDKIRYMQRHIHKSKAQKVVMHTVCDVDEGRECAPYAADNNL